MNDKLELVIAPADILNQKCMSSEPPTRDEAQQAYEIMRKHNGMGISGPQVGLKKRFFWLMDTLCIFPKIVDKGFGSTLSTEGCLSLPGRQFKVRRHTIIQIQFYTWANEETELLSLVEAEAKSLAAFCFQHEYDHLEGKLLDKVGTEIKDVENKD